MSLAPAARARLQATLAVGGTLTLWLLTRAPFALAFAGLTAALALTAWVSPARYAPVQRALDAALHALLAAVSWTALALVYFGVFTPLRGWRQLTHRDPLQRARRPEVTSYLQAVASTPPRFDRQF